MPVPQKKVCMVQGQTKVLDVVVTDADGDRVDLTDATLYFSIRQSIDEAVLIELTSLPSGGIVITDVANGEATVTIPSDQSDTLEPGNYQYDLWVNFEIPDPDIRYPVVRRSRLTVEAAISDFS